jgi:hypothetical protein
MKEERAGRRLCAAERRTRDEAVLYFDTVGRRATDSPVVVSISFRKPP